MLTYILIAVAGIISGFVVSLLLSQIKKTRADRAIMKASEIARKMIDDAGKEVEASKKTAVLEAKEEWYKTQRRYEEDIDNRKKELRTMEKEYNIRLSNLDKRLVRMDKKESNLQNLENELQSRETKLQSKENELDSIIEEQNSKLSEISRLSKEEAIQILKNNLKNKARNEAAKNIRRIAEETKREANKIAAGILATSIQRLAVDQISESTVSVVSLPEEEMKGRIIGREGRNIRTFEKASGIDLVIDDTPEAVVLSGFDPVRREIARLALEKLILDGRIHPGRIEQVVEKTRKEMVNKLVEIGEKACLETNIHNISSNIIKLIGRLHFRTSYGQNVLQHSIQTAWVCGILAAELGLNQELAQRAGFLHDIGKAIDHEYDGSHAAIGANIARKNGESKVIVNAIAAHHEEVEYQSVYAVLTQVADAVSGARPGARREILESYMKRLETMEEIANSIEGVNKSFAIQAGRELRIIVDPISVKDSKTAYIASDIAVKIEKEVQYPGQIKIVVIRETRQSAIAK